jgi:hypothetical protein
MTRFTGLNSTRLTSTGGPSDNGGIKSLNGVYLAKVVEHADPDYEGHVWVELVNHQRLSDKDTPEDRRSFVKIRRPMPFGGSISGGNYSNSYGATFPPPSPGTEVVVAFTGQEQEGFLMGIMPESTRNTNVPGIPASEIDGESGTVGATLDTSPDKTQDGNKRTRHPIANANAVQGIGLDAARGVSSSGMRRESPSTVAGFLTPGGHGLVLDDGTTAYAEGTNYTPDKSREAGKSNLVRLRSGSGAQILLNDSAGIVYIINQNGSGWIQLDSSGNLDIYAGGSISMRATQDFNLYVDGDFNVDADTVNLNARGSGVKIHSATGGVDVYSTKDIKLTTDANMHIKAPGNTRVTSGMIDLNGPAAATASKPGPNNLTTNTGVKQSTSGRVPEHEPWGGHLTNEMYLPSQARSNTTDTTSKDYNLAQLSGGGPVGGTGGAAGTAPKVGPQ